MNTGIQIFLLISVLLAPELATAGSAPNEDALVNLTTSSDVQQQISNLSPLEKKKIEETINIGNKFIQTHFNHVAYEADPDNSYWIYNVAPLVSMGAIEWKNQDWMPNSKKIHLGEKTVDGTRLTCPHVILVSVLRSNGVVTMSYRATIMAMLISDTWWQNWLEVLPDQGDYKVSIKLNESNRVDEVDAQDNVLTWVYTESFTRFYRALDSTFWPADVHPSKALLYKKLSEQIEQQAAQVCK